MELENPFQRRWLLVVEVEFGGWAEEAGIAACAAQQEGLPGGKGCRRTLGVLGQGVARHSSRNRSSWHACRVSCNLAWYDHAHRILGRK